MIRLFIILMLIGTIAKAAPGDNLDTEHDQFVHACAHIGMSATLNTFFLGFYKKMFQMERRPAMGFAAFTTLLVGLSYKYMQPKGVNDGSAIAQSMLQNSIGVILSDLIVIQFDMF